MNRTDVVDRLRAAEPLLRAHGVAALYLFGSYARDEAKADSDLDVFVDPIDEQNFSLTRFMETFALLEKTFPNVEIGYSTRDGIVPSYRPYIERDAIRIF
jgi:predicted nucleotidyltransferase